MVDGNNLLQEYKGSRRKVSIKLAEQGWETRGHTGPQDKTTGYADRIRPTSNKGSVWLNGYLRLVKEQLKNKITSAKSILLFFYIDHTHEWNWLKRYLPPVSVSTAVSIGIPRHIVACEYKLKK